VQLDPQEARELFGSARVARLATVRESGGPHLIPICFALDGDTLFTAVDHKPKRTADLARLRNIAAEPRVSVLADLYDEDWSQLWWARMDGMAEVTDDPAAREHAIGLLRARYVQYTDAPPDGPVVVVAATTWSGWRA
jgi:PPOX class probable F420-dependent enzyme